MMRSLAVADAQVLADVESRRSELLRFVEALVAAPSENPPGDERRVAEVALAELASLGLPAPTVYQRRPERPNLICRIEGSGPGKALMMTAHLDTKPAGDLDRWRTDPFEPTVRDGNLFGLGASDMKGGIAAIVYAARSLAQHREHWRGSLMLVLNADEEAGGKDGAEFLASECGLMADAAVIAEPSGISQPWEKLYVGTRGVCNAWIRVAGSQGHASLADVVFPVKAPVKAAELMLRFERDFLDRYRPRLAKSGGFGVTAGVLIRGGVAPGVMPPWVEFLLDLRIPPGVTREVVLEALDEFLEEAKREDRALEAELTLAAAPLGWREPQMLPADDPMPRLLAEVSKEVLGSTPERGIYPAWTDSLFFQGIAGVPTVPALGPGILGVSHTPNEYVALESVVAASKMLALIGLRFLSSEDESDRPEHHVPRGG